MSDFPTFEVPGAAPIDPAYVRFEQGLKSHVNQPDALSRWRWQPSTSYWHDFRMSDWILEDVSLPPTQSGIEFRIAGLDLSAPLEANLPPYFSFPPLFKAVSDARERVKGRFPYVVWDARTGQWRNPVRRRSDGPYPPGTGPGDEPYRPSPDYPVV
ncbi:hypothetical protein ACFWA6_18745 [Streptomyces sp. NPDC060020]|uniref:hypothetical protein n=1 Tax=Streptomyces sp. NPDC060020 TaxID=3347038 RepID=UPI0036BD57E9